METLRGGKTVIASEEWAGRRVFVTGHTGFKGGWLALWLAQMGATVRGYALAPETSPCLFDVARVGSMVDDVRGDIRDGAALAKALREFAPEVVFHLAAQPLVRASYVDPIGTYETNVMGTAKLLDAIRATPSVRAVVCVTTDKCYENKEWQWGYRESDPLGGYDPYSSSKACAELVSAAFRQSYFPLERWQEHHVALATARAGNVIGGGDWSQDRLIPDLVRGFANGTPVVIRNPDAVRPWQHVLEPLAGYLQLAQALLGDDAARFAKAYNFGPADDDARSVAWIADYLAGKWGGGAAWTQEAGSGVHEAGVLKLDSSLARAELQWRPRLKLRDALDWTQAWFQAHGDGESMQDVTVAQMQAYEGLQDAALRQD